MKYIINEDGGVAGITVAAIAAALTAAYQHLRSNKLEANLLKCYDDDYLILNIESEKEVPILLTSFLKRSKLVQRLMKKNQVAIVNNMDTARLLKIHLGRYPIFNMLFTNKEIKYSGDEFFRKNDDLFKILGVLRSSTSITWDGVLKSIFTLGMSKQVDKESITQCVEANLW